MRRLMSASCSATLGSSGPPVEAPPRGRTWSHTWPISSSARFPARTRRGGWLGLRTLSLGVVVAPPHRDRGSAGQEQRLPVAVDRLPVHVPVRDVDEPGLRTVRQRGQRLHVLAQVVGVGVDGEHVHVHGEGELVPHHEGALLRGNVEGPVVLELQEHGEAGGSLVGEVEADPRPHELGLARGPKVQVEHQVGAAVEAPGHPRRLLVGRAARLPEEEVAVRVEACGLGREVHAGETHPGIGGVQEARSARAIDQEVGVVRHLAVVEADLHGAHVARRRDR